MAFQFDGSNDKIDFGSISASNPTAYAWWAWINTDTVAAGIDQIFYLGHTTNYQVQVRRSGATLDFFHQDSVAGDIQATEPSALTAGTWHRIAGSWDGSNIRLYRDGVLQDTTAVTTTNHAFDGSNAIGYARGTTDSYWDGAIAHAGILHNATMSLGELETTLWHHPPVAVTRFYPLFNDAEDFSGNDDTGSILEAVVTDHCPKGPTFGFGSSSKGAFTAAAGGVFGPLYNVHQPFMHGLTR